jgi:choline dehydrogenase-like flavoprotein
MLGDARELPDGHVIAAQVCIVGAGPAGMSLAAELAEQGQQVCLLEAGGLQQAEATQALGAAESVQGGHNYPNPRWSRSFALGGTAHQWCIDIDGRPHVRYTPLDPIDFTRRDWLPNSGWPIDERDLAGHYARAQMVCGSGPFRYDTASWTDADCPPLHFPGGRVITEMFQFGPRDAFSQVLREKLERSPLVDCWLHAGVVELVSDPQGGFITAARIASPNGRALRVEARHFVLAQGGFEVPRLLLLSDRVHHRGLGNDHDQVGRYLNDHQITRCGVLEPATPGQIDRMAAYDIRKVDGHAVMGKLSLAPEVMEREQLLNITNYILPAPPALPAWLVRSPFGRGATNHSQGCVSLRELAEAWRQRRLRPELLTHAGRVASNLDDIIHERARGWLGKRLRFGIDRGGWSTLPARKRGFTRFEVLQMAEQAPDAANRITLGRELDALGARKAMVHWRWTEIDLRSIRRTQEMLRDELAEAGIGRLVVERRDGLPLQIQSSSHHPAGTTRMSADPRRGVVDAQCRVHGLANLHVASSSVFPTSGHGNPTLTIVALALRIADKVALSVKAPQAVGIAA